MLYLGVHITLTVDIVNVTEEDIITVCVNATAASERAIILTLNTTDRTANG